MAETILGYRIMTESLVTDEQEAIELTRKFEQTLEDIDLNWDIYVHKTNANNLNSELESKDVYLFILYCCSTSDGVKTGTGIQKMINVEVPPQTKESLDKIIMFELNADVCVSEHLEMFQFA